MTAILQSFLNFVTLLSFYLVFFFGRSHSRSMLLSVDRRELWKMVSYESVRRGIIFHRSRVTCFTCYGPTTFKAFPASRDEETRYLFCHRDWVPLHDQSQYSFFFGTQGKRPTSDSDNHYLGYGFGKFLGIDTWAFNTLDFEV